MKNKNEKDKDKKYKNWDIELQQSFRLGADGLLHKHVFFFLGDNFNRNTTYTPEIGTAPTKVDKHNDVSFKEHIEIRTSLAKAELNMLLDEHPDQHAAVAAGKRCARCPKTFVRVCVCVYACVCACVYLWIYVCMA